MRVALISFSNNYDMQEHMYSLQAGRLDYITIGSKNILSKHFDIGDNNYFFDVPQRPVVEAKTFNIFELLKMVCLIRGKKIEEIVFISGHTWNFFLAILLPRKIRKHHVMHEIFAHTGERISHASNIYIKLMFFIMDYFIVHSKAYETLALEHYKIDKKQIHYMSPWMQYYKFNGGCENGKNCLFFGRLNKYKGVENIKILARANEGIQFNVVGRASEEVLDEINLLKEIPNVNLINEYVTEEQIHQYFRQADIVVLPYIEASQSGVIIEAYRHSRPVIAFDVGNLGEQVLEGETGYLIEAGNCELMNVRLREYFGLSLEEKRKYCYNAWNYGKEQFSAECAAQRLEEILSEVRNDY